MNKKSEEEKLIDKIDFYEKSIEEHKIKIDGLYIAINKLYKKLGELKYKNNC